MRAVQIFPAWGMILRGRRPFLAIEITRECPLRCPGCYAYSANHTGMAGSLRNMGDLSGTALIDGVLALVADLRPLHVSLVGGEPLVRYRELDFLLPALAPMEVQLTTSAVRRIPPKWADYKHVHVVISVDGLPDEHNARRSPATYGRILNNIAGHRVIVHCTITGQMMKRPLYLNDFAEFWSARDECRKIWFSLFTPQLGEFPEERLTPVERKRAIDELGVVAKSFPKVCSPTVVLDGYANPPSGPSDCTFARVTTCLSADLRTEVIPCQLGGNPDCRECGCIASAGLASLARYRVGPLLRVGHIFQLSSRIGAGFAAVRQRISR
jgi:MoaA/NifB/PqqE/SkfB family radical SAM enzyme